MKQPKYLSKIGRTEEEIKLLELCELFGNEATGVSSLSLGKNLYCNGVQTIDQLKNTSIKDIRNFKGVGPERIRIYMKMKIYVMENDKYRKEF
jgi:hypothetical protein